MPRSRTSGGKKSKQTASKSRPNSSATTTSAAPVSTSLAERVSDFERVRALIERRQLLGQADAAARELEYRTIEAFFAHLRGEPVDPRITRRFAMQSSGWRVPWSRSAPLNQVPEQVVSTVHEPDQVVMGKQQLEGLPAAYVRLGAAPKLRGTS